MRTTQVHSKELSGTNYEIGYQLGQEIASCPPLISCHTAGFKNFDDTDVVKARNLFSKWCPGLNEELDGFSDALKVTAKQVVYYAMTYLRPGCSHMAILPQKSKNGHPLLARNYEFSDEAEDFTLVRTKVQGKHSHIGTSVLQFGRDDGINECGLAVTMSSSGFPVGPMEYMRHPAITGLQFWAVIRTLLENCKDVSESLSLLKDMPIAYNLNLIMLDRSGNAAIVETLDGKMEVKRLSSSSKETYLHATNHPHLPSLIPLEPTIMAHSGVRYKWMKEVLDQSSSLTPNHLKSMLLSPYPQGLCCHYYKEFFGTTKSMILDPIDGTIDLCWGGLEENGWNCYSVHQPLERTSKEIHLLDETADPVIFKWIPQNSDGAE